MTDRDPILPGATLGVLGGGQLGRMFAQAAQVMGYAVAVLDPDPDSPAGAIAHRHLRANYDDTGALDEMADICAAITTEFENVPAASLRRLALQVPVSPSADAVEIAQNRNREKEFFYTNRVATVAYHPITHAGHIDDAARHVGFPAILKTASLGYDGKGQVLVDDMEELRAGFDSLKEVECILEQRVDLRCEVSVIIARNARGDRAAFPVVENEHRNGILAASIVPARVGEDLGAAALRATDNLVKALDYEGVLAVEYFVTSEGRLLANEMAPRPHNSGHFTIDACLASQYEQQVRAMCNLALADPTPHSPAVMLNLLGDLWQSGVVPNWEAALRAPGCRLHLYGKREARPGRKMGHLTCLGGSTSVALDNARIAYSALQSR